MGRNFVLRARERGHRILAPVRDAGKLAAQMAFEGIPANAVEPLAPDPARWILPQIDGAVLGAGVLFARSRAEYFATNVDWTLKVLEALPRDCRVVVISSQSAGGPTPPGRSSRMETDVDAPVTWYGESKLVMEKAVRERFGERRAVVLRPPMIIGPRDTATLPLFRMARSAVRFKPGWMTKTFSYIAVNDLVEAIFAALEGFPALAGSSSYVSAQEPVTDWQLIASAAEACRTRGIILPVPETGLRILARVVDAVPSLRSRTPSLTRDRVREIWHSRWVVDGTRFEQRTGWRAGTAIGESLQAAHDDYVRRKML